MTERRLLAILGFLLALVGGLLAILTALEFGRLENLSLEGVARRVIEIILGIAAILGGVFIYKGRMSTGGLLTIVIGVVLIVVRATLGWEAILIIVGGILGIVGAETRT